MLSVIFSVISFLLSGSLTVNLLVVLSLLLLWKSTRRPHGIPPGPMGLPIAGYFPFFTKRRYHILKNIEKRYGPVFSLYFGDQLTVVLQDYDSVNKTLSEQGEVFSGRPEHVPGRILPGDEKGLILAEGQIWREHRRYALSAFRDFGAGKSSMEPRILDEIRYFLDRVTNQNGQPFNIHQDLSSSICNNICSIIYGKRFDYDDPDFQKTVYTVDEGIKLISKTVLHTKFPWLRKIALLEPIHEYKALMNVIEYNCDIQKRFIGEHRKNFTPGKYDDYIDAYLNEVDRREKSKDNPELFDDTALNINLRVFLGAGTETTSTTLRWALLFMIMLPDVQRKVQKEIDDVIGRERTPSMEDRLKMPYTEATLQEIHRRGSVVWLNVPHCNTEESNLLGYRIPKRSVIVTNIMAIHHEEKLFPDPYSFRPERFINEQGQFVKSEHVIPFSVGKRFCLGEPLARMELFLYFTSMLQKFTFKNPEGQVLTTDSEPDFMNCPFAFKLHAIPRS
jgi:cytochrome P450